MGRGGQNNWTSLIPSKPCLPLPSNVDLKCDTVDSVPKRDFQQLSAFFPRAPQQLCSPHPLSIGPPRLPGCQLHLEAACSAAPCRGEGLGKGGPTRMT